MADEVLPSGGDRGEGTPAAGRSLGEHDGPPARADDIWAAARRPEQAHGAGAAGAQRAGPDQPGEVAGVAERDGDMWTAGGPAAGRDGGGGDLAEGTQVAGYRLAERIGAGGHGAVFRAVELSRDRWVALKVVSPGLSADPRFRQRLFADVGAAAAAGHPHIAGVTEAGEAGGVLYVAMPVADGGDLGTLLRRRGRLAAARVAVLVSQVAAALDTVHDAGLVHGDVRPANVLLGPAGPRDHAYLSDFGFGYATATAGAGGGRLDYLAPEQIEGLAAGPRADQYALACVAYELLCGEPAFRRGDDLSLLRGQYAEIPLPLTSLRPDLPPEADLVLARALAREPDERYHRCLDFAAALTSACGLDLDLIEPLPPAPPARPAPAAATVTSGPLALPAVPPLHAVPAPAPPALVTVPPGVAPVPRAGSAAQVVPVYGLAAAPDLAAAPVPRPAGVTGRDGPWAAGYAAGPDEGWAPDPGWEAEPPRPAGTGHPGLPPWRADGPGAAGGPGSRRGRRDRRPPVLAAAVLVVLLAIAGGVVMILRSGSPRATQDRHPGAAPHPASSPAGQPSESPSPSPSPSRPARVLGPAGTVRAYFRAINQHRYHRAWRLGGHVSSATYQEFTQGLGTTSRDTLVVLSVNQDTVTARLVAVQTDGSVKTYQGTYVVDGGVITQASVSQIG